MSSERHEIFVQGRGANVYENKSRFLKEGLFYWTPALAVFVHPSMRLFMARHAKEYRKKLAPGVYGLALLGILAHRYYVYYKCDLLLEFCPMMHHDSDFPTSRRSDSDVDFLNDFSPLSLASALTAPSLSPRDINRDI